MKIIISIASFALAMMLWAAVEDDIVTSTGVASTYRGAINEALISALEQHDGVTVSATELGVVEEANEAEATSVNGSMNELSKSRINDSLAKSMQKWAKGKIKSYDIISESEDGGKYRVQLAVHFAGKYECGLPEGNRRRMAVSTFRVETGDSFIWSGQTDSSKLWVSTLANELNDRLTQTRKFTMLDRKFDDEVNAELARLGDKNAASQDAVRLGQKLGTDYLVTGSVKFIPVAAPQINPLTGQTIQPSSQPFCEVNYRVLLAPTGQLKWSDTVRIDAVLYPSTSIGAFASDTAAAAAVEIADGMMANILPFEVVGKNEAGEIIIGEGGKSLSVGEKFTVYVLGDEVKDTRTGEFLDQIETAVGDVEIVRVSAKMSYARVIRGDAVKMVIGSRLRRVDNVESNKPETVNTPTVQGTATGGVVMPF